MKSSLAFLEKLTRRVRRDILVSTTAAASGHPTSSLSAVELMVALLFGGRYRADLKHPQYPNNDRLIFSKGHAAPLFYALYAAAGALSERNLKKLRTFNSPLEGHPSMRFPYTEVPTGSLGQGLSVGMGIAEAARLDRLPYRTYVLLGDSEMSEGSVWEAIQLAAYRKLDNLTAIFDVSRLGQSGPTMLGHNLRAHAARLSSFGWKTFVIDGHDLNAILAAYKAAVATKGRPTAIIAKTVKGKGVSFLENKNGWHGKALNNGQLAQALSELGAVESVLGTMTRPAAKKARKRQAVSTKYQDGPEAKGAIAPREAVGRSLVRMGAKYPHLVVLDAEVKNSTYMEYFAKAFPDRFFQAFIAEQNMAGMANGLASRGKLPVAATFAAFLTRAFDQIRMAQYARTHQIFIGTHVGVSIGEDGPSQMGLEDIAMFRSLQNSVVLCPSDGRSSEKLMEQAVRAGGIVYVRVIRAVVSILYKKSEAFPIGGSKTLRQSRKDRITIVVCGITVHEALKAADALAKQGIALRVIDLYSIKPLDLVTLKKAARETKVIIVAEDHVEAGGVAEAVRTALGPLAGKVISLGVRKIPRSGKPEELLRYEGIDAAAIVRATRRLHQAPRVAV